VASVPLVTALLLLVALLASAAELSRLSAPVVLVLAGLAIGFVPGVPEVRVEPQARRRGRAMELGGPETRLQSYGFFEVVVFLVESALFLLIELGFQEVVSSLGDAHTIPELAGDATVVIAVVLGVRAVWMFTVPNLSGLLDPRTEGPEARTPPRERVALAVAGMRGAVTVAAALSIPMTANGARSPTAGWSSSWPTPRSSSRSSGRRSRCRPCCARWASPRRPSCAARRWRRASR
jgi:NhaP-type Na+/H+ or K+/H+ antiporter